LTKTMTAEFGTQLAGLAPGTTYHFRAKAVAGTAAYGEDRTFTTVGPASANRLYIYIGIGAACGAAVLAYFVRRRLARQL
jgi:hypothetical protein